MILLIDNYDSFVYNLARYFQRFGCETMVVRNDQISLDKIEDLNPDAIVISPGPCGPNEAGISVEAVKRFHARIPILGICLGHQVIGKGLGGEIIRAKEPMHGRQSWIEHDNSEIFENLPSPILVCRYHSLVIEPDSFSEELKVTAWTDDNEIMAIGHQSALTFGFQFHPESILTDVGMQLIGNFLKICGIPTTRQPSFSEEFKSQGG